MSPITDSDLSKIASSSDAKNLPKSNSKMAEAEEDNLFKSAANVGKFNDHLHKVVVVFLWVLSILLFSLLIIRVFHFVAPCSWRWLSEADCNSIERILFSGAILTIITKISGRYKLQ